ncbi:MAG: hypothetical protein Fur0034_21550 [Desulfuromonadia bacterium]
MKRHWYAWGVLVASLSLLAACGGGGGGGGGNAPKPAAKASVSGVALINGAVLTAGVKKANSVGSPLDGAKVTIRSFDMNGTLVQTLETVTNDQGGFAGNIEVRDDGGIVNVKIEKANVISYEKTFPYTTAAELSAGLQLQAELDPLLVKVLSTGLSPQVGFDTAAVDDMVSIAVVQDSRGNRQIVGGRSIAAAKAAGGSITWQLDVAKVVFANASTTSLTVKAQNYNPAKEEDMKRFPAQVDDSDKRLVSAAFDFIDIKDQNGKPLSITKAAAKEVRKSAVVAYRVKKQIPDCGLIVKDEDTTKPGVQIGFYFMRNGKWTKLGTATLYKDSTPDDANLFQLSDVNTCSTLPYAVLTDADISNDIDFDLRWFNFDYVAFGDIQEGCVSTTFNLSKNGVESPLGGVIVSLNKLQQGSPLKDVPGFRSAYGYTTSDGAARVGFTYSGNVTLSAPTASMSYDDPISYQTTTNTYTLSTKDANGCYVIDPVTIAAPECSVTGKVLNAAGAPATGRYVNIYQQGYYYGSQWVLTGPDGTYSKEVFCSTPYFLSVDGITRSFTVDTTTGSDEKSDQNNLVTMNDIQKTNQSPTAHIWSSNDSVKTGGGVSLLGYGHDPDGDPLTYQWSVETGCGSFMTASGASASTSTAREVRWIAPTTPPSDNLCTISFSASDGSLSSTATTDIYVSASGNRPPVISWLYTPRAMRAGSSSERLYAYAYDPDGDTLTYAWTSTCGTLSNETTASPAFTPPASEGTCDVTLTLSDGTGQVTKTNTITITPNKPPVIVSMFVPETVGFGKSRALYASAYDPDFQPITYEWSSTCGTFDDPTSNRPVWTAPTTENTSCTITLTVSDTAATTVRTKQVTTTANTSPVITGASAPVTVSVLSPAPLVGSATDADGDQLSWAWSIQGGGGTLSGTCSGAGSGTVNTSSCSYVAPAYDETATLRFSVSDGRATVNRDVTIAVTSITGGFGVTVR